MQDGEDVQLVEDTAGTLTASTFGWPAAVAECPDPAPGCAELSAILGEVGVRIVLARSRSFVYSTAIHSYLGIIIL